MANFITNKLWPGLKSALKPLNASQLKMLGAWIYENAHADDTEQSRMEFELKLRESTLDNGEAITEAAPAPKAKTTPDPKTPATPK